MEMQYNEITGVAYKGRNQADLIDVKKKEGYTSNAWITFMQAKQNGKKLVNAKGKGVRLLRFSYQDDEEETKGGKGFVKGFTVFNTDLLEDITSSKN